MCVCVRVLGGGVGIGGVSSAECARAGWGLALFGAGDEEAGIAKMEQVPFTH
jgi:hypothetical protein